MLDAALAIVRDEGADRLSLGYLATRAGVSKPVVYDHFATRSVLLIELYRWIDTERVDAFRKSMAEDTKGAEETAQMLARAYIECAADMTDEFHAVGAALAGSEDKFTVFQELLDHCVDMFVAVLRPHASGSADELKCACTGLVGAGEALSRAVVRGQWSEAQAVEGFTSLIMGVVTQGS